MTFETFKKIAKQFRPEITVSQHGNYVHGTEYTENATTVGISFENSTRIYNYSGSYRNILEQLDIFYTTIDDIKYWENELVKAQTEQPTLLFKKHEDKWKKHQAEKIARIEKSLAYNKSLPLLDKKGNLIGGKITKVEIEKPQSEFIGEVGEKFSMVIASCKVLCKFANNYNGITTMYSFRDENDNEVIWKTSVGIDKEFIIGKTITGTIKELKTYRDNKQTVVTRCKIK